MGETEQGSTVYEVNSVRLVLPSGAGHFKRLTPCAKCGRDAVGSPILNVADLERPAHAMYCARCGRSQLRTPVAHQSAAAEDPIESPATPAADDDLLARERGDILELADVNSSLVEAQRLLARRVEDLAAQVATLPGGDPEAFVAQEMTSVRAELRAMIIAEVEPLRMALSDALDHGRSEVASLAKRVEVDSAVLASVEAQTKELIPLQQAVEAMAAPLADLGQVRELVAAYQDLTQRYEALGEPKNMDGLGILRSDIAEIRRRVDDEATGTAALLARQYAELSLSVQQAAQDTLEAVAEPLRLMGKAHDEHSSRTKRLTQWAERERLQIVGLQAAIEAAVTRIDALEARLGEVVQGLAQLQSRPPPGPSRPPVDLLALLEDQLREAEERLSQL